MSSSESAKNAWSDAEKQLARIDIGELKARYCRFLDCKEWQNYAGVFTTNGIMQFGPKLADGAVHGREEIVQLLSKQLKHANTTHRVHPAEFKFHDNGDVSALWPMDDRVDNPGFVLVGAGYYQELYRKVDGQWLIQHMRLHRLRVDMQPKSVLNPIALVMRLVFVMQKLGLLKLLSPENSKTLAQAQATGIDEGLFE